MNNKWMINALGRDDIWNIVCGGIRGGREYYIITFMDETEEDYYIDFLNREIEKC